jgi:DNA-directed RNA polymerase specialized sigma24 family protein
MTRHDHALVAAYIAARPAYGRTRRVETFVLYFVEGLSGAQVGQRLGIGTRSAEMRVRRLRQAARRWACRDGMPMPLVAPTPPAQTRPWG